MPRLLCHLPVSTVCHRTDWDRSWKCRRFAAYMILWPKRSKMILGFQDVQYLAVARVFYMWPFWCLLPEFWIVSFDVLRSNCVFWPVTQQMPMVLPIPFRFRISTVLGGFAQGMRWWPCSKLMVSNRSKCWAMPEFRSFVSAWKQSLCRRSAARIDRRVLKVL